MVAVQSWCGAASKPLFPGAVIVSKNPDTAQTFRSDWFTRSSFMEMVLIVQEHKNQTCTTTHLKREFRFFKEGLWKGYNELLSYLFYRELLQFRLMKFNCDCTDGLMASPSRVQINFHPSIFCCSFMTGSWGDERSRRETQISFSPATLSNFSWRTPRFSKAREDK